MGGLPVIADASLAPGAVRVVLANDYSGPGSGLSGTETIMPARVSTAGAVATNPNVPRRRRS